MAQCSSIIKEECIENHTIDEIPKKITRLKFDESLTKQSIIKFRIQCDTKMKQWASKLKWTYQPSNASIGEVVKDYIENNSNSQTNATKEKKLERRLLEEIIVNL
jgi:predicted glycosyl hydrolase (DUF1957 family)